MSEISWDGGTLLLQGIFAEPGGELKTQDFSCRPRARNSSSATPRPMLSPSFACPDAVQSVNASPLSRRTIPCPHGGERAVRSLHQQTLQPRHHPAAKRALEMRV